MHPTRIYKKPRTQKRWRKRTPEYLAEAKAASKLAFEQRFGSQGAASPVKKIDPVTGEVIAIINPE